MHSRGMRSLVDPMKIFLRAMRKDEALLMNYFKARKLYTPA